MWRLSTPWPTLGLLVGTAVGFWLGRRARKSQAPLVYQNCLVRRVTSTQGLKYKLIISLPHSYHHPDAADKRYPVVYALDGEPYLFPLLATVARTEHFFKRTTWYPDLIVVPRCEQW
eukprot:Skav201670  [mRNA]  locus=scaffold641:344522:344872:+ [translate_table: standard]